MEQMTLAIAGMSCGSCVATVRKALRAVPGVQVDAVELGSATVSYDASRTTPAAVGQAVRDAGYDLVTASEAVAAGAPAAGGGCCCGGAHEPARDR